jgi:hypothetical protein
MIPGCKGFYIISMCFDELILFFINHLVFHGCILILHSIVSSIASA